MKFPVMVENIQTVTTIYNSKILSIPAKDFSINYARIDILNETVSQINEIVHKSKLGERFEGKDYTSGNLNREI